jgi:phosphatidylglycerophosphate synthase
VLELQSSEGDGTREIAGLPVALRLALDAQRAGASAIVAPPALHRCLSDPRLTVPVLTEIAEGSRIVRAPEHWVTHRQLVEHALHDSREPVVELAEAKLPQTVPFGFDSLVVTDSASARRAERALFHSLRKPQDGWTSRYLNRYISLAISRLLVKTPLRPNQVSVLILLVGLAGAAIATRGSYWALLLGAFLFQAQSVLDGCDGEMSRVTYRGSKLGEWLDTIGDDLTNYGFFAGAAWGLYQRSGQLAYLIAGAITVGCGVMASGIEYRYLIRIGSGDLLKYPISAGDPADDTGLFAKIQPLFKRDTFVFLTLVAAVFGWVGPMLFIFCLGGIGILASVIAAELRMARERRQATAEPK